MALDNTLKDLRRAAYIGKDFNTYVAELTQFVKQEFGEETFNDFSQSDLGVMFLELVAYANSTLSFYLDLQAGETYLDTAKLRNSVVRLCRNIGFKMLGAVPATTSVQVSMQQPKDFDVPITKGAQLSSKPGFFFETLDDVAFDRIAELSATFKLAKNSNIAEFLPAPILLANDAVGTAGNQAISDTVVYGGFVIGGMSGGAAAAAASGILGAVAGISLNDGETFTLNDGSNPAVIFEFDKDSVVVPGNIPVQVTNAMDAGAVAIAVRNAVNGVGAALAITAALGTAAASDFVSTEVGQDPVGQALVRLKSWTDTSYRRIIAVDTASAPNRLVLESAPPTSAFGQSDFAASSAADPLLLGDVGPKTVAVREGQTTEELFLSTGRPNQNFKMQAIPEGKMVAEGSVRTYVNNVEYDEVKFITYEQRDIFEAQLSSVPAVVRFGDSLAGNIPPENADIRVVYFATSGVIGNIPAGQITSFRYPVVVNAQSVSDVVVSQPLPSVGGSDFFPLSRAKAEAPYVFKAQDRAVTPEDYEALASTFVDPEAGAVGKAKAIVVRSIGDDFVLRNYLNQMAGLVPPSLIADIAGYWNSVVNGSSEANVVQIGVLTVDAWGRYRSPAAALLSSLTQMLDEKKEATVDIQAFDGTAFIVPMDINVSVKRTDDVSRASILTNVKDALVAHLRSKNFGDPVRLGDLYEAVETIEGVNYSRLAIAFPPDPTGYPPAYYDAGDLIVGVLQIVEPRNIEVTLLE